MALACKKMPVGADDFKKVRETCYLVDKTQFISDFLRNHNEVTLRVGTDGYCYLKRDNDGEITYIEATGKHEERLNQIYEKYGDNPERTQGKLQILYLAMLAEGNTPMEIADNLFINTQGE